MTTIWQERLPLMKRPGIPWPRLTAVFVMSACFCGLVHAADPAVSNVRASQRTGTELVDIWYDVSDGDGDQQSVSVSVTVSGTPIPTSSFSGSVGSGVTPGNNRHVVWDAGADWDGQYSSSVRFTVTANDGTGPAPPPSGMVLIPGGSNSGTNPLGTGESHDSCVYPPTYSLTVGSFYMDRYEVTKALWDEVATWAASNGYDISAAGGSGKGADHPVYDVTWYECVKWCNARTEYENATQGENRAVAYYTSSAKSTVYRTGQLNIEVDSVDWSHGYRLPTDEEWEYAARGGAVGKRFPWGGDTISHSQANYYANTWSNYDLSSGGYHPSHTGGGSPYTSPVGAFEAGKNAYGLYDMAGNVWEWCWDWHPCYAGSPRVARGGSWYSYRFAPYCRVADRNSHNPDRSLNTVGFRAVLPPGQQ